jgi:hypothetical protein
MLQFNNNHIFTGYLKRFLSSFNLPTCKIYTEEFENYYAEHGREDPRVIESNAPISISGSAKIRSATGITYLKEGCAQQYFWKTNNWNVLADVPENKIIKHWHSNKSIQYNGNKILGFTKTLKNPTTLYNYQTHEYLGDYLRFLRDYEGINLMSMYNCFSDRLCNNVNIRLTWEDSNKNAVKTATFNAYDTKYKIYMLPAKLFADYTIALDCYQGIEMFCGLYTETLDTSDKAKNLMKQTYMKVSKNIFSQPILYDKLNVKYWNWQNENTFNPEKIPHSLLADITKFTRAELAILEDNLKLFIKVPATNTSSIAVLEGNYINFNDAIYMPNDKDGWQYKKNSTVTNFETKKTYKYSSLPDINSRKFKPISKLQLLSLNTGISYPFADRLIEYLVLNVIIPTDRTPDNIKRLQKVMEDCGHNFQINGVWEPKMQMILYDYLMNSGKFIAAKVLDGDGQPILDKEGQPVYKLEDLRSGNLKQRGQCMQANFYDILGYVDKDAEKLYTSWTVTTNQKTKKPQVTAKTTLENVDIYSNLYNN